MSATLPDPGKGERLAYVDEPCADCGSRVGVMLRESAPGGNRLMCASCWIDAISDDGEWR